VRDEPSRVPWAFAVVTGLLGRCGKGGAAYCGAAKDFPQPSETR
jgi:hypothetical protein